MITIVNLDGKETSTYEIRINRIQITTFQHTRSDGLAECLRLAAEAVEKEKIRVETKIIEENLNLVVISHDD